MLPVPPRLKFHGNTHAAKQFKRFALSQLEILKKQMSFQGLKQGVRRVSPFEGVLIECVSKFGLHVVNVFVAPCIGAVKIASQGICEVSNKSLIMKALFDTEILSMYNTRGDADFVTSTNTSISGPSKACARSVTQTFITDLVQIRYKRPDKAMCSLMIGKRGQFGAYSVFAFVKVVGDAKNIPDFYLETQIPKRVEYSYPYPEGNHDSDFMFTDFDDWSTLDPNYSAFGRVPSGSGTTTAIGNKMCPLTRSYEDDRRIWGVLSDDLNSLYIAIVSFDETQPKLESVIIENAFFYTSKKFEIQIDPNTQIPSWVQTKTYSLSGLPDVPPEIIRVATCEGVTITNKGLFGHFIKYPSWTNEFVYFNIETGNLELEADTDINLATTLDMTIAPMGFSNYGGKMPDQSNNQMATTSFDVAGKTITEQWGYEDIKHAECRPLGQTVTLDTFGIHRHLVHHYSRITTVEKSASLHKYEKINYENSITCPNMNDADYYIAANKWNSTHTDIISLFEIGGGEAEWEIATAKGVPGLPSGYSCFDAPETNITVHSIAPVITKIHYPIEKVVHSVEKSFISYDTINDYAIFGVQYVLNLGDIPIWEIFIKYHGTNGDVITDVTDAALGLININNDMEAIIFPINSIKEITKHAESTSC